LPNVSIKNFELNECDENDEKQLSANYNHCNASVDRKYTLTQNI